MLRQKKIDTLFSSPSEDLFEIDQDGKSILNIKIAALLNDLELEIYDQQQCVIDELNTAIRSMGVTVEDPSGTKMRFLNGLLALFEKRASRIEIVDTPEGFENLAERAMAWQQSSTANITVLVHSEAAMQLFHVGLGDSETMIVSQKSPGEVTVESISTMATTQTRQRMRSRMPKVVLHSGIDRNPDEGPQVRNPAYPGGGLGYPFDLSPIWCAYRVISPDSAVLTMTDGLSDNAVGQHPKIGSIFEQQVKNSTTRQRERKLTFQDEAGSKTEVNRVKRIATMPGRLTIVRNSQEILPPEAIGIQIGWFLRHTDSPTPTGLVEYLSAISQVSMHFLNSKGPDDLTLTLLNGAMF